MKNVYTQNRGYRLIIPAKETRERRAGFLITRADYIEFDPFPLRHFESTSSFAKKRRLSSSTSSFSSFLPLFPFSPRSHSTSRHEFSSYPLSRYPLPPRLPPLSLSLTEVFLLFPLLPLLLRASSLSRGSRRLFLPRGCFIRRQKNIAAESRWRWGSDAVSRNPPSSSFFSSFPPPPPSPPTSHPRHCCREQERQNEPDC